MQRDEEVPVLGVDADAIVVVAVFGRAKLDVDAFAHAGATSRSGNTRRGKTGGWEHHVDRRETREVLVITRRCVCVLPSYPPKCMTGGLTEKLAFDPTAVYVPATFGTRRGWRMSQRGAGWEGAYRGALAGRKSRTVVHGRGPPVAADRPPPPAPWRAEARRPPPSRATDSRVVRAPSSGRD